MGILSVVISYSRCGYKYTFKTRQALSTFSIFSYYDCYPLFAQMATHCGHVLGIQEGLLLANGSYMLLFPSEVTAPSSLMAGTAISVIHDIRLAP